MTPLEIHTVLIENFGEAVFPWKDVSSGDPFISIRASEAGKVLTFMKCSPVLSFDFLRLVTAVDWNDRFGVVYHLYSYRHHHEVTVHLDLPRDNPSVESVVSLWPTAEWMECEAWDMMGIVFEGHPDLKRILLPLDWEGYPLRKDYRDPAEYHGIKHGE